MSKADSNTLKAWKAIHSDNHHLQLTLEAYTYEHFISYSIKPVLWTAPLLWTNGHRKLIFAWMHFIIFLWIVAYVFYLNINFRNI